ncbi:hypothetical protein Tco_0853406, partial [Tanacetum coccineum]
NTPDYLPLLYLPKWGCYSAALTTTTTTNDDELTLAKTLIEIKEAKPKAKPKVITTATTIVTVAAITRPSKTLSLRAITSSPKPSQAKDKGKAKMLEPKKSLKRKEQIMMNE